MDSQRMTIDISITAILKVIFVLGLLLFLFTIRDILLLCYIVLIFVAALSPVIDNWSKRINRTLAITLLYLIIFAVIALIVTLIFPPVISQIQDLTKLLPGISKEFALQTNLSNQVANTTSQNISELSKQFFSVSGQIFTYTRGVVQGFVAIFTVIVLSFYLLLEQHGAKKFMLKYLPLTERETLVTIGQKIGEKMGAWMRGQLLLALIIGVANGIGLAMLGIPFVLTLAIWAGFTELIPYVGPVIGAVPAVILAFLKSPIHGILTLILFIVVQQLEANFLVPKIMQRAVGLSPIIIILSLLVGGKLAGLLGILLAIPTAVIIDVLISEWPSYKAALSHQYNKITKPRSNEA